MYLYLKSSSQRHSPSSLTYHKRVLSHFFTVPPQKCWMRSHPTVDQLFTKLENLKVQEVEILHQIKIAHKLELEDLDLRLSGIASDELVVPYTINNRVCITNRVRNTKNNQDTNNWWATLTSVNGTKVHLTIDSGFKTWRLSENLKFLRSK